MTKLALEYTQTCECLKDFKGDFFCIAQRIVCTQYNLYTHMHKFD